METSNLPAHPSQHILHSLIELIMQYSYWHSRRMAEVVEMCVCVSVCVCPWCIICTCMCCKSVYISNSIISGVAPRVSVICPVMVRALITNDF